MARTFNGTSDQIAFGSEAAIDDLGPFTACALVRPTASITDERQILTKMNSSFNGTMYITAVGTNRIIAVISGSGNGYAETVDNVLTANAWNVVVTQWDGTDDAGHSTPHVYVCTLGSVITEPSYATTPTWMHLRVTDAAATLRIGARDPADATFFSGGLAECALWNRMLTADELQALGRGYAPAFFPNGRVFYSKVDGRTSPELNYAATTNGTVTGTTYLDHPPVIYPSRMSMTRTGAAGSSFKAAWARGANVLIGTGAR